jgi:hypothetical protein
MAALSMVIVAAIIGGQAMLVPADRLNKLASN